MEAIEKWRRSPQTLILPMYEDSIRKPIGIPLYKPRRKFPRLDFLIDNGASLCRNNGPRDAAGVTEIVGGRERGTLCHRRARAAKAQTNGANKHRTVNFFFLFPQCGKSYGLRAHLLLALGLPPALPRERRTSRSAEPAGGTWKRAERAHKNRDARGRHAPRELEALR